MWVFMVGKDYDSQVRHLLSQQKANLDSVQRSPQSNVQHSHAGTETDGLPQSGLSVTKASHNLQKAMLGEGDLKEVAEQVLVLQEYHADLGSGWGRVR
jgi:hypothetical protein